MLTYPFTAAPSEPLKYWYFQPPLQTILSTDKAALIALIQSQPSNNFSFSNDEAARRRVVAVTTSGIMQNWTGNPWYFLSMPTSSGTIQWELGPSKYLIYGCLFVVGTADDYYYDFANGWNTAGYGYHMYNRIHGSHVWDNVTYHVLVAVGNYTDV